MSVSRYNGDTPRGLEVFAMKKNAMNPHRLAVLAMMTAVVFAVNFPRIIIPLPTGETSFTLANIACVLSGMLLGPLGGLASGLGSALYDLTNPIFAPECWLTFLTKGAMGLAAGLVFRTPEQRETASYRRCLASSLVGCLTYYLLYFSKSLFYDNMLWRPALCRSGPALPLKIPASLFNAAAAIAARAAPVSGHPGGPAAGPSPPGVSLHSGNPLLTSPSIGRTIGREFRFHFSSSFTKYV